jgi:GNAT superfamily N-acetyltransferase
MGSVIGWTLSLEPIRNAFTIHDLANEPQRSRFWVARVAGLPSAHLLVRALPEYGMTNVQFSGESSAAEKLLEYLPGERAVVHASPHLAPMVAHHLPGCRTVMEDVMQIEVGGEHLSPTPSVVRLGPEVAEEYAQMVVPATIPITPEVIDRNRDRLREQVVFGVFREGRLVSVAGSSVRTPATWIVGGVETLPSYRRLGYARQVSSAVTREALEAAGRAGLWVRRDNAPAVHLYTALGYRKIGGSAWIDIGTGIQP